MIQFHKALSPYKYQGVFYAAANLPHCQSYLSKTKAFSPYKHHGVFYANCYQVTSYRHQEGHYQTDDARLQKKEGGGNCLIAWSTLKP